MDSFNFSIEYLQPGLVFIRKANREPGPSRPLESTSQLWVLWALGKYPGGQSAALTTDCLCMNQLCSSGGAISTSVRQLDVVAMTWGSLGCFAPTSPGEHPDGQGQPQVVVSFVLVCPPWVTALKEDRKQPPRLWSSRSRRCGRKKTSRNFRHYKSFFFLGHRHFSKDLFLEILSCFKIYWLCAA